MKILLWHFPSQEVKGGFNLSILEKLGKQKVCSAVYPQTAPQNALNSITKYSSSIYEPELYKTLRYSVPIIDTAILKLVRLTGGFTVKTKNGKNMEELTEFIEKVNIGTGGIGLQQFIDIYFAELLTYGTAGGEIVTNGKEITSLYNVPFKDIHLKRSETNFNTVLMCKEEGVELIPCKYQQLCIHSVLNPDAGCIKGNSILKGLPFVSSILLKIFNTIGQNWDRAGNIRYAVTYDPGTDMMGKAYAQERAMQIAKEWANAMSSNEVKDFVAVGDVKIKVIGADNQILSSDVPVRQLMEQIVAKLGLPPFMLGLSWSTTERMSSQQADALSTEIRAYRRILTPVIEKICSVYLRLLGNNSPITVEWEEVSLRDAVETSKSQLYLAQANKIKEGRK